MADILQDLSDIENLSFEGEVLGDPLSMVAKDITNNGTYVGSVFLKETKAEVA